MAIVNGIHPYIDRIINEVQKLTQKGFIKEERIKEEKYQYMDGRTKGESVVLPRA